MFSFWGATDHSVLLSVSLLTRSLTADNLTETVPSINVQSDINSVLQTFCSAKRADNHFTRVQFSGSETSPRACHLWLAQQGGCSD